MNLLVRDNNETRLLTALQGAGKAGISTQALVKVAGSRFGGRLCELRKKGWLVETILQEDKENALYILKGKEGIQVDFGFNSDNLKFLSTLPSGIEIYEAV